MRYLSVCSGIEAATQAWHPLGWQPVAFSEIERFPSAVLAHHYPAVPNWGDMTRYEEWPDADVDVLCGGTPCQDYSVAGLRLGMAGSRGQLTLTYVEIAARYRPRWLVYENVPGILSSNSGRDFARFLGDISGQSIAVPDGGWSNSGIVSGIPEAYGLAYRVLDAQHVRTRRFPHAVPQRRRRVWVVAYLGDWRRAAAVLFDRESLSGHPAPRREAGQGFARGVEFGPQGGGFADVNPTLDTRAKDGPIRNQLAGAVLCADVAPTLNAHFGEKQGLEDQHINGGAGLFVAHALRGEGFDASEDGTGRGTPIVPVGFSHIDHGNDAAHGVSPTMRQNGGYGKNSGTHLAVATHTAVRRLTPRECERLMGFPDDFTRIPYRGKPADACPDGPRYKALGNSWAVNCAEWICERIAIVDTWRTP